MSLKVGKLDFVGLGCNHLVLKKLEANEMGNFNDFFLLIERFFNSDHFKTAWLHSKSRKLNSMGSLWPIHTHGHPDDVLIVK